jgi:hypothetical protein
MLHDSDYRYSTGILSSLNTQNSRQHAPMEDPGKTKENCILEVEQNTNSSIAPTYFHLGV